MMKIKSNTSKTVVLEMLQLYSDTIRLELLEELQQSPAFSLMLEDVTDVTTNKHLTMCLQFLSKEGEKKYK